MVVALEMVEADLESSGAVQDPSIVHMLGPVTCLGSVGLVSWLFWNSDIPGVSSHVSLKIVGIQE